MLFKKVLVPYDESEHALSAVHTAFDLVGDDPEAELHIMSAVTISAVPNPLFASAAIEDPFSAASEVDYDDMMGALLHRIRTDMEQMVKNARDDAKCKVKVNAVICSSPVEGIAEYVDHNDIDLIVMGRRGLGALRGMLGSVSFGVLRSVDVPVLTVK